MRLGAHRFDQLSVKRAELIPAIAAHHERIRLFRAVGLEHERIASAIARGSTADVTEPAFVSWTIRAASVSSPQHENRPPGSQVLEQLACRDAPAAGAFGDHGAACRLHAAARGCGGGPATRRRERDPRASGAASISDSSRDTGPAKTTSRRFATSGGGFGSADSACREEVLGAPRERHSSRVQKGVPVRREERIGLCGADVCSSGSKPLVIRTASIPSRERRSSTIG